MIGVNDSKNDMFETQTVIKCEKTMTY